MSIAAEDRLVSPAGRARLAASESPKRIFKVTVGAASAAGLVGVKRVLDSTPLYDAVARMDTVTPHPRSPGGAAAPSTSNTPKSRVEFAA